MTELTNREEELMIHKVELSSMHEKLKIKVEDVSLITPVSLRHIYWVRTGNSAWNSTSTAVST